MTTENDTRGTDAVTVDGDVFRTVVGHLASGVAVVTTVSEGERFGMTVSSVTSLSLDPPLMLVCLNSSMRTTGAVQRSGAYAVNVLDRRSAHLAGRFAAAHEDKFAGVRTRDGVTIAPLLDDALAQIECEVVERIVGGTHTIFIGRVVGAVARDGEPLTYFRGGFGRFELERDDQAYVAVRTELVRRRWEAHSVLDVDEVAFELDLPSASVFYALTKLGTQGLVARETGRGYVVVPVDLAGTEQAFDARSAIELGAFRLARLPLAADVVGELRARFDAMAACLVEGRFVDFDGYLDANDAFHRGLVGLAGSAALEAAFDQIGLRTVMAASFGATPATSQRFLEAQHRILTSLADGDRPRADAGVLEYAALAKERAREILAQTGGVL